MTAPLDVFWIVICALLVFLMQPGFAAYEIRLARSKTTINLVMGNLLNFGLSASVFWLIGFGLMFGPSAAGWVGAPRPPELWVSPEFAAFFLLQLMVCGVAATIVSGAAAGRMRLEGRLIAAAAISGLAYPLFGRWTWGEGGWLGAIGFVDFAGSTVVHSVGGWAALMALIVVGPQRGRFDGDARIEPHSLVFAMIGVMLVWFGWFGLTGGGARAFDDQAPAILVNTVLAPVGGVAAAIVWDALVLRRNEIDVRRSLNAVIGGLVAITAGCHVVGAPAALAIGAVGGVVAARGDAVLERFKVDDAVGAVPAHLFAGIWGTLAIAVFADDARLGGELGVAAQFGAQLLGVVVAGLSTALIVFPILWGVNTLVPLRIAPRAETRGPNTAGHGASTALQGLMADMDANAESGEFAMRASVNEGDETALIAAKYGRVLERARREVSWRESTITDLERAKRSAEQVALAKSNFLAHMSHELRTPLHAIIGFADLLASGVDADGAQRAEYASAISESGRHLLRVINDILEYSRVERDRIELRETLFSLTDVLQSVTRMLQPLAEARGVALALRIDSADDVIEADEKLIKQAVINVASNAVKFAAADGVVSVVASREADGRLAIAVTDNGPGIPPDQINLALQPFRQTADAYTRDAAHRGTGLGLPLAQSFVKLHGGTLTLSPATPNGLIVTMRLPAERVGVTLDARRS